jgi:ATP-dependent exoDNAse (exonuclease V) alpha subunit
VRGAALSGIAAEGLEAGSGIRSRTLASLEHAWGRERELLQRGDVLVIDEAGMVGTRQMERVLARAAEAGAKLVLVGDPEQLQSIAAGGWFRDLVAKHGAATLSQVRRQRDAWQREATVELATGRTEAALLRYEAAGMLRAAAGREEARAALIEAWSVDRQAAPARSRIMLAATRADVRGLNELARERLQEEGLLARAEVIETARGSRSFAAGDRVLFLRNERSLGVKNGTLGTVERVEGQQLQVRLDGAGERRVSFHARDYDQLEHGYATTIHKAQGTTVDYSYLLLTGQLDRHGSYVALSRHRHGVAAFYAREEFADLAALTRRLGRDGSKAMALPGELAEAPARDRMGGRLAALGRVGEMARGAGRRAGGARRMANAQPQRDAAAAPEGRPAAAGSMSRLERQVALGREIAEQLRQQRAAQREVPARQDSAEPAPSGVVGSRLEQQVARGREIAAELKQGRTAQRDAAAHAPAQQAGTSQQATRLAQQIAIARRVAARLRQRSRERDHGLEL